MSQHCCHIVCSMWATSCVICYHSIRVNFNPISKVYRDRNLWVIIFRYDSYKKLWNLKKRWEDIARIKQCRFSSKTIKIAIKILQGSAVTLNALGGLTIHTLSATFLQCTSVKNYENRFHVKVTSQDRAGPFYWDTVYSWRQKPSLLSTNLIRLIVDDLRPGRTFTRSHVDLWQDDKVRLRYELPSTTRHHQHSPTYRYVAT